MVVNVVNFVVNREKMKFNELESPGEENVPIPNLKKQVYHVLTNTVEELICSRIITE